MVRGLGFLQTLKIYLNISKYGLNVFSLLQRIFRGNHIIAYRSMTEKERLAAMDIFLKKATLLQEKLQTDPQEEFQKGICPPEGTALLR